MRTLWKSSVAPLVWTVLLGGTLLAPPHAYADDSSAPSTEPIDRLQQQLQQQQKELEDAQQKLDQQLKQIKAQEQALDRQQQQINALKAAVLNTAPAGAASTNTQANTQGGGVSSATFRAPILLPKATSAAAQTAQTEQGSGTPPNAGPSEPQQRPEVADVSLASAGGVLTPKGVFSFEPTYQYQYASNNQVLINGLTIVPGITIGSASVRQLVDRMSTFTLGGRLGVTDRFEIEAEVPWVYRNDSTTLQPLSATGAVTTTNASGSDLGDIQFGGHYQLNSGAGGWPYFVANLLVKTRTGKDPFSVPVDFNSGIPTKEPTGTGFWAVQPSITAIYPSDPVVFFANLRYIANIGRTVTLQPTANTSSVPQNVTIDPGDGIGGSFGMGFGINDKASFSLAYEETYLMSTAQDGVTIPGSSYDIGDFTLGFAYQLTPRTTINLGIAIGTTKASPDTAITLRIPIKFQVF